MAPQRVSSNGDVDHKPPASIKIDPMNTTMNNNSNTGAHHHTPPEKKATLPRHPNAKGGLPNEMPDLPAELERGVSSLSLLRGLSSGFDPNLSMGGFFPRGISIAANNVNSPQGDSGGGIRVSSTAAGRKEKDGESGDIGVSPIKNESM